MRTVLLLSLCAPLLSSLSGCSPITLGAQAIQPSQAVDTKEVWIYLRTSDQEQNGVWRCYDSGGKPSCLKAKMVYRD